MGASHYYSPHLKFLPFPLLGRRGKEMRANVQYWDTLGWILSGLVPKEGKTLVPIS
jgi:hypothetical protein